MHPRPLPVQRHEPGPGRHDLTQRYSRLVRGAIVLLAGLAFTASANAAPPAVTATATPAAGVAPFRVTLTAAGDAASYSWTLGDGATAAGPGRHACLRGREVRRDRDRDERRRRGLAGTGGRDGLEANADAGSADARRLRRARGARRVPATRGQGRSRPDLPRPDLRHLRPGRRQRPLPRAAAPAPAGAVPRPLRSGAIDRASRAPPPDDRGAVARDRSRRLDTDAAPAARARPGRVALRPRLPRRPPRPRPPRSREASDRQARHPAGGAGLQAARRLRARPQGGRRAGRASVARSRLARPERRRAGAAAGGAPLRAARRRRLLRKRHVRSGARVPEGERAASDRPRRAVALAPARPRRRAPRLPRRRLHRGRQDPPGAAGRPGRRS